MFVDALPSYFTSYPLVHNLIHIDCSLFVINCLYLRWCQKDSKVYLLHIWRASLRTYWHILYYSLLIVIRKVKCFSELPSTNLRHILQRSNFSCLSVSVVLKKIIISIITRIWNITNYLKIIVIINLQVFVTTINVIDWWDHFKQ